MATYYAQSSANWDAVSSGTTSSVWNSAANGSGTWLDLSGLVSGTSFTDTGNTYDIQTYTVTLSVGGSVSPSISVAQIRCTAGATPGIISVGNTGAPAITVATADTGLYSTAAAAIVGWVGGTSSLTVNGDFTYGGTSTSGCIPYTTSQTVTINGKVTNSSSGYALVGSGSGVLTISNSGGTAVSCTGSGRVVSHGSSGALTVTGSVSNTSSGRGVYVSGNATVSVTGNVTCSGASGYGVYSFGSTSTITVTGDVTASAGFGITCGDGTVIIAGNVSSSATGVGFAVGGGTLRWTGSRTLSPGSYCYCTIGGGTLQLATTTDAIALACSGSFVIYKTGGTLTLTASGNNASLVRQIADAQIAVLGADATDYITGPALPTAGNVETGSGQYGYAGDLQTPDFDVPAESDVKTGVTYGDDGEFEGTYSAGGNVTIQISTNGGRIGVQEC